MPQGAVICEYLMESAPCDTGGCRAPAHGRKTALNVVVCCELQCVRHGYPKIRLHTDLRICNLVGKLPHSWGTRGAGMSIVVAFLPCAWLLRENKPLLTV